MSGIPPDTRKRDEPPHSTRRGAGERPTFVPPDSTATSDEPGRRSPLKAPRPSMPFGTFVKDDNPVVATSLDSYLDNPDTLSWKDRTSLLPKTDEYPGWDGDPSKLLKYLQTMDVFIRVNQIPERILLAKFRSKLSGEAEQFYSLRVGEPPMPNSWEEWKEAFRERFLGRNWQREMQEKYRAMQYSGQDPNDWLEKFITALRSVQPNASADEIQQAVQLRVPQQMAMNLEALRGRQGTVSLTQFMRNFEEMATLQFPHGFRRSNPSRNSTTSDPSSNRSRPPDPRRTVPSPSSARPVQSAPTSRPAQASASGSGPTPRRCYICQSTSHISPNCPQKPAVAALADGESEQESQSGEEASPDEQSYESSDGGEVNEFHIEGLSSDSYYWLENSPERLKRFDWLDLANRPFPDSLSAPEDVAHPLDYVLALDSPLSFRALDTAVLSIGHEVGTAAEELANSGAPVLVSSKQALRLSSSVQTSDAPMRTKAVKAGHAHTTALSLTTRVLINGNPVTIFLDTGAGPSVADAHALDKLDVGWRTRLQPMPHKTSFTAFGSKLSPIGVVKTALVFPHPAGNLRLSVEFAVIETGVAPIPFIFGMDWMLAYGVNVMLEHGPYFTIGRAKQRFAIATKTGFALPYVDPDEVEDCSNRATVAAVAEGRPTTEPAEFEKALALVKVNPELKPEQLDLDNLPPRIKQNAYPASPRAREAMKNCIGEFLDLGIIRESKSQFAAPALIVFRGEKARLVVNYKVLNSVTTPDAYPMPRIDQSLYSLKDSLFFSSMDANKGFHQIPMNPAHTDRTAFSTPFGQYEYLRMPMGLRNAPAEFQRRMDKHFHDELREGWMNVYIDDLLAHSRTFEEHLVHLERMLAILDSHGWTMSPAKCFIGFSQIRQLGHRVSGVLLGIDDNKIVAVKTWPAPTTVKELQVWLGFTGYFRKFIPNYGAITRPLTRLLGKDTPWQWTKECQEAFEKLKDLLLNAPVLGQADYQLPFELSTDASVRGLGGCLEQIQQLDGAPRKVVICFISRQLNSAEEKYSMPQLECLAVVWALEKLHIFLDGVNFTVWTDAGAMKTLMDMQSPSRHMLRWQLAVQEHRNHLTIRHRAGKANGAADGLSRCPLPNDESNPAADLSTEPDLRVQALSFAMLDDSFFEAIRRSYTDDKDFSKIHLALREFEKDHKALIASLPSKLKADFEAGRFLLLDELVYRRKGSRTSLVVLDKDVRTSALSACHDEVTSGHFSLEKTYARLQPLVWWPGMYEDTLEYCKSCNSCQRANHATGKPYGLAQAIKEPTKPWDIINMDFVGPFSKGGLAQYDAVLVVTDRYSRRCRLIPTFTDADARQTAALFYTYVLNDVGVPLGIISDRDKLFTSEFWKCLAQLCGYKLQLSTSYHPQTDGLAERYIRTLEDALRRFVAFEPVWTDESGFSHDWTELLPGLEFAINSSKHATLGKSPFEVERGYIPRSVYMLMKSKLPSLSLEPASEAFANMLLASQERAASCIADAVAYAQKRWDEKHVEPPFEVGDEVLVSTKHFQFKGERKLIPPFVVVVEKVLDQRAVKPKRGQKDKTRKKEFLVKWEGYPEKYNRWVLEDDLQNAKEALQDYFESRRLSKRREDVEEDERPKKATFANGQVPLEATPHMHTRSRAQKSP
ncbi:retrotransposon polyprotein [Rhodotorula toruloides]|uniref:Retrotransposon polyprotein n=1 Tax=Rhodotorula toruloides TaxID=5286 RepID=A0A511KBW1_RHOTO|nr:retrotransposon polyprotein [Rhodotorula toruloides]